jgi:ABC-type uncharacterized transport system auxiliary subunit
LDAQYEKSWIFFIGGGLFMFLRSKVTVGIVCAYAVAALLSGCGSTESSAPKDIVKVEENAGDTSAASEENASEETAAPEGSADA